MWRLTHFGTVNLPAYNEVQDVSPAPSAAANVPTTSTGFDQFGTATAPQEWPQPITAQAVVYQASRTAIRAELDLLRSKTGQRNSLWRTAMDNDTQQYAIARLVSMPTTRQIDQWDSQPITLNFELWTPWRGNVVHGAAWVLDSGIYLDTGYFLDSTTETTTIASSPGTATVTNSGNMPVLDAILTVTAGGSAITALALRSGAAHLVYSGTIAAGSALVINAGAWSVKNAGVNAWSQFSFGTAHAMSGLLELTPGSNSIVATFTGGGTASTINVEFYDTYA
jgi:hypothetical protein